MDFNNIVSLIIQVFGAALLGLAASAMPKVAAWLDTMAATNKDKGAFQFASFAVQAAEQWLNKQTGPNRFAYVDQQLTARFPALSEDARKVMIEAAVRSLKAGDAAVAILKEAAPLTVGDLVGFVEGVTTPKPLDITVPLGSKAQ